MRNRNGFTLIEIIVIIVLAGIAIGVMVPFLGSALTRSHAPLDNLGLAAGLSSEMAKVIGDYNEGHDGNDCAALVDDWDVGGAVDADKATWRTRLCYFDEDLDGDDVLFCLDEGEQCPDDKDICVFEVRLQSVENPGEYLNYYFSCEP